MTCVSTLDETALRRLFATEVSPLKTKLNNLKENKLQYIYLYCLRFTSKTESYHALCILLRMLCIAFLNVTTSEPPESWSDATRMTAFKETEI